MNKLRCRHCSWRWYARTPNRPAVCPHCGSARWDKAPQVKYRKKDNGIVKIGGWTFSDEVV